MTRCTSVTAILLICHSAVSAQVPSPSARALGMGDNHTAAARGFAAPAWNPALLGLEGNPRGSLAIFSIRGIAGLDPIAFSDIDAFEGAALPAAVREDWLQRIERAGRAAGTTGGDVTYIALQRGKFALQLSSSLRAAGDLSPGAAELLLFGNAGRTGEPRAVDLAGSSMSVQATSTAAFSYAAAFRARSWRVALGTTARLMVGHFLLAAQDDASRFGDDAAVRLSFPVLGTSHDNFNLNSGSGIGADAGVAIQRHGLTIGAVIRNVVNTFAWHEDRLAYREGVAIFEEERSTSRFAETSFSAAPAHLRGMIAHRDNQPAIAFGASWDHSSDLTITADARRNHAGIGAELRALRALPIRAGIGVADGGLQLAGGIGFTVGVANVSLAVARKATDIGSETVTMISLFSTSAL